MMIVSPKFWTGGLMVLGTIIGSNGLYLGGKAFVAQVLLDRAWTTTLKTGQTTPPWAWMDAFPIAKIEVPATNDSAVVLDTISGQALAFGPAHLSTTPLPGEMGISVIAAHKNTHFSFLKDLVSGDQILVQRADGQTYTFIMTGADIVHKDDSGIPEVQNTGKMAQIALVTCYPFNAVSFGGPLRYVVYGTLSTSNFAG